MGSLPLALASRMQRESSISVPVRECGHSTLVSFNHSEHFFTMLTRDTADAHPAAEVGMRNRSMLSHNNRH